jgi:transglutaminase-like putative cysteine protease
MTGRRIGRPEEGWLPLALVLFMALTLAWAIDDPGWVNGKVMLTDDLPLFALLGVAIGFAGPKLGWGRWTTHLVGAGLAALLIPVFAGWALHPGASIAEAFTATASGTINAYLDIAWRGRQFTSEEIHYILVLGIAVWGTAQFAAYAVFGHRRPLNAVVIVGLVLISNMALTKRDQLPYLVAFTATALFLLIAMHAFDERTTWVRRRIGDPGAIASLYLRGGTVFIVLALLGSLMLSQRAASSPLAGAWTSVNDQLIGLGEAVGRLFPVGGDIRGTGGVRFDSAARISNQWFSDNNIAFQATVPAGEAGLKWRAATYDTFALTGWEQTDVTKVPVPAGEDLLVGTPENPVPDLTRELKVEVRPDGYQDSLLLSPGTPTSVSNDSVVLFGGTDGWFNGVEIRGDRSAYTVTARVLNLGDADVISKNRLRVASTSYPAEIKARYTDVPAGAMGPDAQDLLATIEAQAQPSNPYDLAVAIEKYLRDDGHGFHYSIDIRAVQCSSDSAVECFARTKQGYCLHYASTMAILLRAANPSNPIPTRLVQGFLPGELSGTTETVLNKDAHAWVEVYFPGYGWIPFDPTGGGIGQQSVIQEGPVVASPSPTPAGTDDRGADPTRRIAGNPGETGPQGPTSITRPEDRSLFIVLTAILALLVAAVAFVAWIRGPRGEINPDSAWLSLSRGASRLGFAPRPTQTIYEYAASLGELVPVARADLQTVADAKVETAYARVRLGGDRLRAVSESLRRLRVSLLRLAFRRGRRGLRRRS